MGRERSVSEVRSGSAGPARREIDGGGLCLAPGLIDTHAHDDGAFLRHPSEYAPAVQKALCRCQT